MTEQRLSVLQQWMKAVVTERGGLPEKLRAASEQHGLRIENIVAEKRGLSAQKRMSIYTTGYVIRLLECLRADFPALRNFVGDAVFDAFAGAYIINQQPKSHSLFDLGASFPQFLEETKPKASQLDAELTALLDLPAELAKLERARSEVMRARGTEHDGHVTASFSPDCAARSPRERD
ncbi:MAG: DNA-binding domain-containing protein [Acidobacteria bacterium]|nr:DNA-binding domain-containing protein [Acidobacteriota bacterium]